jgi:type II secretory ATPase GspE/PulE/Tfp pilus assembly ATPase PilB-like protein
MSQIDRIRSAMTRPLWGEEDTVDSKVERLLEQARRDAANSGHSVEEVLQRYGFDLETGQLDPSTATPARPRSKTLDGRLLGALSPMPEDEAKALLDSRDWSTLARDACFLGLIGEPQVSKVLAEGWAGMLACGVGAEDIAELVRWTHEVPPPATSEDADFADHLLSSGLLRFRALNQLRQEAQTAGAWVWTLALDRALLSDESWRDAVADYSGLSRVSAAPDPFPEEALSSLDRAWVERFDLVPLRVQDDHLICAVTSVPGPRLADRIVRAGSRPVRFVVATPGDLRSWKARWVSQAPRRRSAAGVPSKRSWVMDPRLAQRPAVELVEQLIELSLKARATDLHLEPVRDGGRMRLRIDGTCQEVLRLPSQRYTEVVSRLKVLADLDVTERRLPQDGHIGFLQNGREQNVRIATVPARGGEKVAMRFANSDRITAKLDELGLKPEYLEMLRTLTARPFGMILATGPVGSGKTTTLYSCLQELDRDNGNVMSIEDPVEVELSGVTQLNVNYAIGFDFVAGLRSLLRQDPDAILVGEIRDEETARIAIRASMTGLRVFSTMHTNDATGAVTALRNFHLSSHLIASSLTGVIAQRLVRRLCMSCRQEAETTEAERQLLQDPSVSSAWAPRGCEACRGTGYAGRVGVFEILRVDEQLREYVLQDASERKLRTYARKQGLVTLQEDGVSKIGEGLTSVEEYRRILNF